MNTEKRRSHRQETNPREVTISLDAMLYRGVVENLSEHGLHVLTVSWDHVSTVIPDAVLEIEFKTGKKETIKLQCKIRWVHINRTPFYGFTYRMGVDILPHSPGYNDYIFHISSTTSMTGNG